MRLRMFRRAKARSVQPGDLLERPKPIRVEETVNGLTGMKLQGYLPGHNRKTTIEVKGDDDVEFPVEDPAEMRDLLTGAFKALAAQIHGDEVREGEEGWFAYQVLTSGEISVTWKGTTTLLAFEDPTTPPVAEPTPVEPTPAKAPAAKKAAAPTEKKS